MTDAEQAARPDPFGAETMGMTQPAWEAMNVYLASKNAYVNYGDWQAAFDAGQHADRMGWREAYAEELKQARSEAREQAIREVVAWLRAPEQDSLYSGWRFADQLEHGALDTTPAASTDFHN